MVSDYLIILKENNKRIVRLLVVHPGYNAKRDVTHTSSWTITSLLISSDVDVWVFSQGRANKRASRRIGARVTNTRRWTRAARSPWTAGSTWCGN